MNCVAAVVYEDYISPHVSQNVSQEKVSTYLKWIAVVIGLMSTGLVFIIEHLGNMSPIVFKVIGTTSGPMLGVFIVGMLFPNVNAKVRPQFIYYLLY